MLLTFASICRACKPARCYLNHMYCGHTLNVKVCCLRGVQTLKPAYKDHPGNGGGGVPDPLIDVAVELETILQDMDFLT